MNKRTLPRRETGMTLVELMVGMLIGLIGIVIITHLYVTNEQYKRRVTSTGSAQSNGAIALYALERELRMASFGLNHERAFACQCDSVTNPGCSHIQYYYDGTYSFPPNGSLIGARNALSLYPVVITDQATGPDSLSVFYGSDNERMLGTMMQAPGMTGPASNIRVDGTVGFEGRDLTISEAGNLLVLQRGTTCSLVHVTGKTTDTLLHDSVSKWNPPGGGLLPGAVYDTQTMIFNLGSRPNWKAYSIKLNPDGSTTGKLQVTDQLRVITDGAVSEDMMDGIVDLQAQYGLDTTPADGDGVVDVWTKCITYPTCPPATPATETEWRRVIAVRLAVLARSEEWIKPASGTTCEATTTANRPGWSGTVVETTTPPLNPTAAPFATLDRAGALPSCYQYRVFETVVPLRNMLWRNR